MDRHILKMPNLELSIENINGLSSKMEENKPLRKYAIAQCEGTLKGLQYDVL